VIVILHALAIPLRFVALEIVFQCTQQVEVLELQRLEAVVEELPPLHRCKLLSQPVPVLRKLACLPAGCILDAFSEFLRVLTYDIN
jgi:hypothetical protein